MEATYRISSDNTLINYDDIIVIESNLPSSDIPYFTIIIDENGKLIIRNEFVIRNEHIESQRITNSISLKVGEKTGRIYEVDTFSDIKKEDVLNSINSFIKKSFIFGNNIGRRVQS